MTKFLAAPGGCVALLIALKLAAVSPVAGWSWAAVTAPLWVPWLGLLALVLGLLALALFGVKVRPRP